ncbi:DUF397 domain-containing protein [Streptomyces aureoverticillatus]|uniref:DUF397 domain-containing protein n=1 Tax=Streptomyces aureoverticillatus TaxID=66871 RepID=UPI0013DB7A48|nr:DUF397 domain-containing protein [Streptomyces aureoverticillatus]QIB45918.1 DUF397 domain-containing protein [Streptomyces aureoverticillatus]
MHEFDLSNASWRKSSYSNGEGGDCVEVAYDFVGAARWRKSTYSNGEGGSCLEVADGIPGLVPLRDSKVAPHGPVVIVGAAAWNTFIRDVGASTPR